MSRVQSADPTHYCQTCGKPLTSAWPYALCEGCGKLPCIHGNTPGECNQCDIEGDRAYDAVEVTSMGQLDIYPENPEDVK